MHAAKVPIEPRDLKADVTSVLLRITVPVAIAAKARRHRNKPVLPARLSGLVAADMLNEQQFASWLEHTIYLSHTRSRIADGTEHECRHDTVEAGILKRQMLGGRRDQLDGHVGMFRPVICILPHRLVWLDSIHAHHIGSLVVGEVLAGSRADLQHDAVSLPSGRFAKRVKCLPAERHPVHPFIECRKIPMLCLGTNSHTASKTLRMTADTTTAKYKRRTMG